MVLKIDVHDRVKVTERLRYARGPRKKRRALIDARDDVDRCAGRPTWKELVFDHDHDLYKERVVVRAPVRCLLTRSSA